MIFIRCITKSPVIPCVLCNWLVIVVHCYHLRSVYYPHLLANICEGNAVQMLVWTEVHMPIFHHCGLPALVQFVGQFRQWFEQRTLHLYEAL